MAAAGPQGPGDADRRQLDRVVSLLRDVLARDVVGAYLFGSAVLGGLRPASDLDVLAVSARPTTRAEKRRLVERLLALSGHPRRLELTLVVQCEVRPWQYPPRFDFQYGDWLRSRFEAGELEPWPTTTNPDLACLIAMVLLADAPLHGPPPAEALDPVPPGDLARALVESVPLLLEDLEWDTRNVVLTLARVWSTLATGSLRSKDAAADWALTRLPAEHRPVLAHARAIYLGDRPESWDEELRPRIRPHVDHVRAELAALARGWKIARTSLESEAR